MKRKPCPECCPSCGRPLPPRDFSTMLGPIQRRIFELVKRRGEIAPEVLFDAIYGFDPNGGPSRKALHMSIHLLNKRLAYYGLAVRSGKGGNRYAPKPYRLIAEAAE